MVTAAALDWLNLPALTFLEALPESGAGAERIGEVCGSLKTILAAALARRRRSRVLLIVGDDRAARDAGRDLAYLLDPGSVWINPPLVSSDKAAAFEAWGSLGERMAACEAAMERAPGVVVSGLGAALERVPSPAFVRDASLPLAVGAELDLGRWSRALAARGHRRVPLVEAPGEFAVRGGILDVYPVGAELPIRVELWGDEIDSIRSFEPTTQRSVEELRRASLLAVSAGDYLRARRAPDAVGFIEAWASAEEGGAVIFDEPEGLAGLAEGLAEDGGEDRVGFAAARESAARRLRVDIGPWSAAPEGRDLGSAPPDAAFENAEEARLVLRRRLAAGESVQVIAPSATELERCRAALLGAEAGERAGLEDIEFSQADLGRGFRLPRVGLTVLSSVELLDHMRGSPVRPALSRRASQRGDEITALGELAPGEAVVHVVHGIGLFRGLESIETEGEPRDHLMLEYRDKAYLYVPVDRIGLVRRYIGPRDGAPPLSKLGGKAWIRKKTRAEQACQDLAAELLEIQAAREVQGGTAFPEDDDETRAFAASFPFEETPDQMRTIIEVGDDLQAPRPMDRIICGDVGFGKTEVALRAAFKVAMAGRQVAIVAPTTILAHQHHRSFTKRMANHPLIVEVLSRFRSRADQRAIVKRARAGGVDILIGTHRLFSRDVGFKQLGLVIIDEEQRFGVAHKEALKALRRTVDVLTLTATPIPRTLHMALSGARDISVIATPPLGRIPVKSLVARFDEALIAQALERELQRGGQVFFVHDRVGTIDRVASLARRLAPEARVAVGHGQMDEAALEETMLDFVEGRIDVLVSTKIVENGLDVPRANTLIINRADRFGLAELHQLRGRVGRHRRQAFAFFLLPRRGVLTEVAEKRLRAIEEYRELGAGFRIALRDLEIRGAGSLLGSAQSGHIGDVGYDLYCRLLRKAVDDLRAKRAAEGRGSPGSEKARPARAGGRRGPRIGAGGPAPMDAGEIEVALPLRASIPESYMPDVKLKIEAYRKLSMAESFQELVGFVEEVRDRYGPMPSGLRSLLALRALRLVLARAGVSRVSMQDKVLILIHRDRQLLQAALRGHEARVTWVDQRTAYVIPDDIAAPGEELVDFLLEALGAVDAEGMSRWRRLVKVSRQKKRGRKKRRGRDGSGHPHRGAPEDL